LIETPITESDGLMLPESEVREIRSALAYLDADDRDMWVKVGMCLKSTHTVQAKGLWTEWSMKSPKFDPVDQEKKWKTFKPTDITIASIFAIAKSYGWVTTYNENFDPTTQSCMLENEILTVFDELEKIKKFQIKTYAVSDTFQVFNRHDIQITRDALIVFGGERSSGKTSIVTHYAFDILTCNPDFSLIFFSLDDSEYISARRIISQGIRDNVIEGEFNAHDIHNILKRIVITESDPPSSEIKIKDKKISISDQMISIAEQVKKTTGTSRVIFIIDYLQYVKPSGERSDLNLIVKQFKMAQKKLAATGGCIMFLLSQLNRDRDSENRFRETSEIENVADVILTIRPSFIETQNPSTGKSRHVIDKADPRRFITIDKNKIKPGLQSELHTVINNDFTFQTIIDPSDSPKKLTQTKKQTKRLEGQAWNI
jgi:replicative DNA helicase